MPRLYRKQPDSSAFTQPRVLVRVFAEPGQLEQTVRGYESLTKTALDMDLDAHELGIRIVAVGGFLVLDLDPAQRERFELARRTLVTMIYADLDSAIETSIARGAELLVPATSSLVGRGAFLRHADGLLVEYVEHRATAHDADSPAV
jgi:hypothetical protein